MSLTVNGNDVQWRMSERQIPSAHRSTRTSSRTLSARHNARTTILNATLLASSDNNAFDISGS